MKNIKIIITLILMAASATAFALPHRDLDHMDLVDLTQSNDYRLDFTVQYPGLGGGRSFNEDCLALIVGKRFVKDSELKKFSELVSVVDGDGVLFPGGRFRQLNVPAPEIVNLGRNRTLVFKLKDLGKYVTGLRLNNFTVYAGFASSVKAAFGETTGTTAFQFLRGCKI